ncbi:hypothetical protein [Blastopirellula marina]|uniref:Uncharacterized protein n=1 Tax=Blastopirellula marina TaxID=124 RepID=A0A2S8FLJ5_9BACT|nr:hypothetical protein [Blastopirellula marina]PQO33059.1 hypothetical protein C5Y98_18155 [Blastopirellula marina]PTL43226.1 hypothetical protein C5Y97_18165 [Blastopirellula marina]
MLKGCGLALLLLTGLVGGYMVWFDQFFKRPESLIFGAVAGVIVFFCIGALENAWRAFSDWKLVSRAQFGSQLYDGYKTAVAGPIRPEGEPLTAPFSGKPCVICEYDIARRQSSTSDDGKDTSGSDYAGFMMTPSKIDTRSGEVRLLGYPSLEDIPEQNIVSSDSVSNARKFLASTQFEDRSGLKIVSVLSVFGELWADDDGKVEKHMRLRSVPTEEILPPGLEANIVSLDDEAIAADEPHDDQEELEDDEQTEAGRVFSPNPKLVEKRVEVGETVVVFGIYDEMRRGLLPPHGTLNPNRLMIGTAEEVEGRLRTSMLSFSIGGLLFLILVHAAFYFALKLPDARKPLPEPEKAAQHGQLVGVAHDSLL